MSGSHTYTPIYDLIKEYNFIWKLRSHMIRKTIKYTHSQILTFLSSQLPCLPFFVWIFFTFFTLFVLCYVCTLMEVVIIKHLSWSNISVILQTDSLVQISYVTFFEIQTKSYLFNTETPLLQYRNVMSELQKFEAI